MRVFARISAHARADTDKCARTRPHTHAHAHTHTRTHARTHTRAVSGSAGKVSVTASFGGLLMLLSGDKRSLGELALDQKVYLLVRKV